MKRLAPRQLSSALSELERSLEPASTLARVQRVWERATGPALAAAGRPTAERDGVVTVVCSDSMWAQELEMMGPDVSERLNEALGEALVKRLRCRAG